MSPTLDTAQQLHLRSLLEVGLPLHSQPFAVLDGCKVRIGASVGVVFTQYPSGQMAELLRRADAAMYEAKKAGKSQYCFAFPV